MLKDVNNVYAFGDAAMYVSDRMDHAWSLIKQKEHIELARTTSLSTTSRVMNIFCFMKAPKENGSTCNYKASVDGELHYNFIMENCDYRDVINKYFNPEKNFLICIGIPSLDADDSMIFSLKLFDYESNEEIRETKSVHY